jgi:hypothetical protein
MRLWRPVRAALTGWLCIAWMAGASAHPMPESRVWIDTTPGGLRLTLQMQLIPLESAFGQPLADYSSTVLAQHGEALSRYLLQHVGARSGNVGWQALRPQLAVQGDNAAAELEAVMELRAPPGADPRSPTLLFDAITHEVRTHRVQVFLRNDWAGGMAGQPPLLLGELDFAHNRLPLVLDAPRSSASIVRLLQAGAWHIAEGTDHLLFLFLLLLVAPLQAQPRCWGRAVAVRPALRQIVGVVTAFTVGHSLTLVLGSSGLLVVPSQPVEVAVAATIAIAAVHAWRPLFLRGDALLALGLGLIHGLAFSASLSGAGLTPWQHAQALLAFNLGIELMQLALLALLLPLLLALAQRQPGIYHHMRRVASVLALLMAVWWMAERLEWLPAAL